MLGPRPAVDLKLHPISLPDDLDRYLATSEARFADLRPGVEKTIIWADARERSQTPLALVYLHGFSATRRETSPLTELLGEKLGANVFYTRLRGHGRSDDAMSEATVNDWLNDGIEALEIGRRLGEEIVLIGTSTGGTLATWLVMEHEATDILALVLISPNFRPRDRRSELLLWPWGASLARMIEGDYRSWTPVNERQARYWTTRYPTDALVTMMSLVDLVRRTDLRRLGLPALLLYSRGDELVDADEIERRYRELGSTPKELVEISDSRDPAQHVLAGDILSPSTTDSVADQIESFIRGLRPD